MLESIHNINKLNEIYIWLTCTISYVRFKNNNIFFSCNNNYCLVTKCSILIDVNLATAVFNPPVPITNEEKKVT